MEVIGDFAQLAVRRENEGMHTQRQCAHSERNADVGEREKRVHTSVQYGLRGKTAGERRAS